MKKAILTRYTALDHVVNLGLFICALLGHPSGCCPFPASSVEVEAKKT